MTNKEAIQCLTCMAAEVEWEYPIDWQVAINELHELLNICRESLPNENGKHYVIE